MWINVKFAMILNPLFVENQQFFGKRTYYGLERKSRGKSLFTNETDWHFNYEKILKV